MESRNTPHQVTKQLTEFGEYVTVLTPSIPGDAEFDRDCGYPVTRYVTKMHQGGGWKHPIDRNRLLIEILKANSRRKVDYLILGSYGAYVGAQVALASKLLRKPFFMYAHGASSPARPESSALAEVFRKFTLRAANRVICVSDYVRSLILEHSGLEPQKAVTILNGVDLPQVDAYLSVRLPKNGDSNATLVTISRLDRCKGIDRMIEAMPRIVSEAPGTRYIVVGSGDDEWYLKNLASQSPAGDAITFTGPHVRRPAILNSMKSQTYSRCPADVIMKASQLFSLRPARSASLL